MRRRALIDTGPLVALIDRRDRYHTWTRSCLTHIPPPLFTCEAVLSEACFLLRGTAGGPHAVLDMVTRGLVRVAFDLNEDAPAIAKLLDRYREPPMSLADACLVRMSEREPRSVLITLDGGFRVYRRHGRQVVPTIMPDDR